MTEDLREKLPEVKSEWNEAVTQQKNPIWSLVTYLGLPLLEVSSGYQKACRRCIWQEAVQWALDMSMTAMTNAWNRSKVIAVEDIGPADPRAIELIFFCENEAKSSGQPPLEQLRWMARAAYVLATAKKTRVNDWMMRMYDLRGQKLETAESLGQKLGEGLEKKDIGISWFYADALFQYQSMPAIRRFYEQKTFQGNSFVKVLAQIGLSSTWAKDGKHRLLLAHIINLHCTNLLPKAALTRDETIAELKNRGLNDTELDKIIELVKIRDRSNLLGLPDYAIDMHTSRGKKKGRDLKHFIEHGSKLNNIDEYWEKISATFLEKYWKTK